MDAATLSAFQDEIEKIAFEYDKDKAKRIAKITGGALLGGAAAAGGIVMARPTLRAHVKNVFKSIGHGYHALEKKGPLPQGAVDTAKQVAEALRKKGLDPAKARIAIAGTGGTGKSTMARALGEQLGMAVKELDGPIGGGTDMAGKRLANYLKKHPPKAGSISEQTHILTQVNPDKFDAIIHISKPYSQVEKQIIGRGRGAAQLDFYDYKKLDKSIGTAFKNSKGDTMKFQGGVSVKLKPAGGFQSNEILDEKVLRKGMDPDRMNRAQKVLAVAHGEKGGGGIVPYIRKGNLAGGAGIVGAGAGAGAYGAARLTDSGKK